MERKKKISIVVSVYNEEAVLEIFYNSIHKILQNISWDYELIFVNDGSVDNSEKILEKIKEEDEKVRAISFIHNFGHEAAMIAGIDHSTGDGVICMDSDLQHPPELIEDIIQKLEEGNDVVTMIRKENKSAGLLKNITSSGFYWVINILSKTKLDKNASDFFGISKNAADLLKIHYRGKVRFLRGFIQELGLKKTSIEYIANDRAAGESKYSIRKLIKFSINAILCMSDFPLRLGTYIGRIFGATSVISLIFSFFHPSLFMISYFLFSFFFSLLFFYIGLLGKYIEMMISENRKEPIYIEKNT